jgi:hypothetical protein
MTTPFQSFARRLCQTVLEQSTKLKQHPHDPQKVLLHKTNAEVATLDLTPFEAVPSQPTANQFFARVENTADLFNAYSTARAAARFEQDIPQAYAHVHTYAERFLTELMQQARSEITDEDAQLIANWVKHFDIYVAVKAIESLLHSKADLALLQLAKTKNWQVHFDHLAIRCGSSAHQDAERIVRLLTEEHGYVPARIEGEDYYQFTDGWNAYPLYKIFNNGQVQRLFIDQSDANHPKQIIQHWNHVYGYTAHHLAMRATQLENGARTAVSLEEIMRALQEQGLKVMTPTGLYTEGLLVQVFTRPEQNKTIPPELKQELAQVNENLEEIIENAKLLELVSRKELPPELAREYFALYGLTYEPENPLHSVPIYHYFLPAQAAHVIKTSVAHTV